MVVSDEWTSLGPCRARVRELEESLRQVGGDYAAAAQSLTAERLLVERLRMRVRQLEDARDAADERARLACEELERCKRQGEAGGTRLAKVTTLKPKPRRT